MASHTAIPSASGVVYDASITNASNAYSNTSDSSYATVNGTYDGAAGYAYFEGFSFSAIPDGATISAISIKVKGQQDGSGVYNDLNIYNGTYWGYGSIYSGEGLVTKTISMSLRTVAQLKASGVRILCSAWYYDAFYIYGAEVIVTYTVPDTSNVLFFGMNF